MTNIIMNKYKINILIILFALFVSAAGNVTAADYHLGNPTIEMRRLQICEKCHEPLVVTSLAPGAAVRCPKCALVQRRLPNSELKVAVYQICPSCTSRLDVSKMKSRSSFKCGFCGLAQRVLPEAVYLPNSKSGTGKIPDGPTIEPSARILKKEGPHIPEPVVPGLNAPSGEVEQAPVDGVEEKIEEDVEVTPLVKERISYKQMPELNNQDFKASVTVNGNPISQAAVAKAFRRNYKILFRNASDTDSEKFLLEVEELRKKITEELIGVELILQSAQEEGVEPSEGDITRELQLSLQTLTREEARRKLIIEMMRRKHSEKSSDLSSVAKQGFYQKNIKNYSTPDKLSIDAIVIYNERAGRSDLRAASEIAAEIDDLITKGVSFNSLARRYSEGPFRGDGGVVRPARADYIALSSLARPLQEKEAAFTEGNIVGPVELPGCFVFAHVKSIRRGAPKPFYSVVGKVTEDMLLEQNAESFKTWIASLRSNALVQYSE